MTKKMYTLREAAEYSGLSYNFWWTTCKKGKIRYVRAGNRYLLHKDNIDYYLLHGDE